jgi:predicted proteasome-type protease
MFLCCTKQDYLKRVVADSKEYSTLFDILNRYEALHAARMELTERQEKDLATLQSVHSNMVKSMEVTGQIGCSSSTFNLYFGGDWLNLDQDTSHPV